MDIFKDLDLITRKDVENRLDVSQSIAVSVLRGFIGKAMFKTVDSGKRTLYMLIKQ